MAFVSESSLGGQLRILGGSPCLLGPRLYSPLVQQLSLE